MRRKKWLSYIMIVSVLLSTSCATGSRVSYIQGNSTPYKTFEEVNKAIINGDIEKIYFYLSVNQRRAITLEELKENYKKFKDSWIDQAKNAKILHLAMDEKEGKASAVIDWGLGDRIIATFILEEGIWKEDTFIPLNKR